VTRRTRGAFEGGIAEARNKTAASHVLHSHWSFTTWAPRDEPPASDRRACLMSSVFGEGRPSNAMRRPQFVVEAPGRLSPHFCTVHFDDGVE
jgi:hypothetical protein